MTDGDFGSPIVAIANSYTQFVPGHVHLKDLGEIVADAVRAAGGVPREFHTIAVDDGIAMGHGGMLYSLPSREVIADAVEYMVNGHAADALVCISNCDKITPGMLNAAMRLNIPTVFVSGGPMEAGKAVVVDGVAHAPTDLITAISASASAQVDDEGLALVERSACPTCGSCSGMFTANSMNCLTEALGLALPGNGSTLATHAARRELFSRAGTTVMELAAAGTPTTTRRRCPARSPPGRRSRTRWRSTWPWAAPRTPCCTSSPPRRRARSTSTSPRSTPSPGGCRAWPRWRRTPTSTWRTSTARAASPRSSASSAARACCTPGCTRCTRRRWRRGWTRGTCVRSRRRPRAVELFHAAPGGVRTTEAFSTANRWSSLDTDAAGGCIRDVAHAYTKDGGLAVLRGNIAPDGAVIKAAGIDEELWHFAGPARVVESQEEAVSVILAKQVQPGDVLVVRYEGPSGGPGMQEMLHPTAFLKGAGLGRVCALITDGRFSGGSSGISVGHISPEAAAGGVIGLIENGDRVVIDVHERTLALDVPAEVLAERRAKMEASERPWQPRDRDRPVSKALRAYAALATSAHTGAVRRVP